MKKVVIISLLVVVLLLNSCKFLSGEAGFKYDPQNIIFRITESKSDKRINDNVFNEYIKSEYGILSDKYVVDFIGNRSETDIRGVHGWYYYDWIRAYSINTPFMSKSFEVWIDNRTHKVFGDNFYEVLARDEKFNHLYSDWVKKQIGCEDENIEMKFYGSIVNDAINIEFNKIVKINDNYDEIFNNLNAYYCIGIKKKNIGKINNINAKEMANDLRKQYLINAIRIKGIPTYKMDAWIELYSNDFSDNSNCKYYFYDIKNEYDSLKVFNY